MIQNIIDRLNVSDMGKRLCELDSIRKEKRAIISSFLDNTEYTNNHIHTSYSFSPYSPSAAVYMSYINGLSVCGIVDHDTMAGAREFIQAGKIIGIATTIGCEVRVSFTGTSLEGKRINNPDEVNSAYITIHGVPHNKIDELDDYLSDIRAKRNTRNKEQIRILNSLLPASIRIDYDKDVYPHSLARYGGSITERHILMAVTNKAINIYGQSQELIRFLESFLDVSIEGKARDYLLNKKSDRTIYAYDVLNVLKTNLVPRFFLPGWSDSYSVFEVVKLAKSIGAIPTYCYLGDIKESPTGDKKAQKFEDDYLGEVFETICDIGFEAVSYMPSRNTMDQLVKVMEKAKEHGLMQISGEDINQPRQKFICDKLADPVFHHLNINTWALVGHELLTSRDCDSCIYSDKAKYEHPVLADRMKYYAQQGRMLSVASF